MLKLLLNSCRSFPDSAATFGWLCVETWLAIIWLPRIVAATFGWLCVETPSSPATALLTCEQPPSGGCVLKPFFITVIVNVYQQPPSGGCVLKHPHVAIIRWRGVQPPSGGCVLKHPTLKTYVVCKVAATFGWLCVETSPFSEGLQFF